uniref:Neuroendocrine convertase 2 n=1 Tax=Macrostomum lignano TaxID=282301 RepID=A0A1I8GAG1_9PLAT
KRRRADPDGEAAARRVTADINGLRLFHAVHDDIPEADSNARDDIINAIAQHPDVKRATQQQGFRRNKRGFRSSSSKAVSNPNGRNNTTATMGGSTNNRAEQQLPEPNDPLFEKAWFLKNTGQSWGTPGLDLNVLPVWEAGYIGRNVTVAIVDDGIDYLHPDLAESYNAEASFDFNSNDPYPFPKYADYRFNSHGTRCAGEVSAKRNNRICSVGVAPGSRKRLPLSHRRDIIDIYSASWGPTDDGKTLDRPLKETSRVLRDGITLGRGGLGSIFVWASGNGGPKDDCNCDGYTGSMWTISINSVTNDGSPATYGESCSSTLASTFSNGRGGALMLAGSVRPGVGGESSLTWRDMQHLVVLTSRKRGLQDESRGHKWERNAAGLQVATIYMALGCWTPVQWSRWPKFGAHCQNGFECTAGRVAQPVYFDVRQEVELTIDSNGCDFDSKSRVRFIEHVQAFVTLRASRRGDVLLFLTSPSNTTSMLLGRRPMDSDSKKGFTDWPFMTTHMWGESAAGQWTLRAEMSASSANYTQHGLITDWTLVIHRTQNPPYRVFRTNPGPQLPNSSRQCRLYTKDIHLVVKASAADPDGEAAARRVTADINGLRLFHAVHDDIPEADSNARDDIINAIAQHPDVKRATQQQGFRRNKRGFRSSSSKAVSNPNGRNNTTATIDGSTNRAEQQLPEPNDPLFEKAWFLKNTGQSWGTPGLDLNVLPVWEAGYIGRNVTVAIVDDGIDYLHPDLAESYNAEASFDFNSNDPYPFPKVCRLSVQQPRHSLRRVGVAPGSRVASLRILDQLYMTDLLEAAALSHRRDIIDIYSVSWGPTDDGKTLDRPLKETSRVLRDGITLGRGGLGSI